MLQNKIGTQVGLSERATASKRQQVESIIIIHKHYEWIPTDEILTAGL